MLESRKAQLLIRDMKLASLPEEARSAALKKLGWIERHYAVLAEAPLITARTIHECRINLFTGMIFNRCISPHVMCTLEEIEQDAPCTVTVLKKMAGAVNKIFLERHASFIQSFVAHSNQFLPDAQLDALQELSVKEERIEHVSKGASGKKRRAALPGDAAHRAAQRDWISAFRESHQEKFGDKIFEAAFATRLRRWRQTGEQLAEAPFKAKLLALYQEAERKRVRHVERLAAERKDAAVAAATPGNAARTDASSVPDAAQAPARKKEKSRAQARVTMLNEEQIRLLETFLNNKQRIAFSERFPALRQGMETGYIEWLQQDTGGNPVLAMQAIFEEQALIHFFHAMQLREGADQTDFQKLRLAFQNWKQLYRGEKPQPHDLARLWHGKISPTSMPAYRPTMASRVAEAAIDRFLQGAEVERELADGVLKAVFLNDVKAWMESVGPGGDVERIVMDFLESALLNHFVNRPENAGMSNSLKVALHEAVGQWRRRHPGEMITTDLLKTLRKRLAAPPQQ
jgi:hypothetical protein